jgi:hypothetical protein
MLFFCGGFMKKLAVFLIIALSAVTAFAGITVTEDSGGDEIVTYYQSGMIASYYDGQMDSLIDTGKMVIYSVDSDSGIIMKSTFDEMKEIQKLANKQLQDMAASNSYFTAQSNKLKSMKVKVDAKGSGSYAGYSCDRYIFSVPDLGIQSESCYSKKLFDEIIKEADLTKFMNVYSSEDKFLTDPDDLLSTETDKYARKGYTLFEKASTPGDTAENTEVKSVKKGNISADVFKLPEGLSVVGMKEFMQKMMIQQ